ncbi:MAG: hypothetical protein AAFX94_03030 [Myxococcota bacterium]
MKTVLAIAVAALAASVTYSLLNEAYGAGPPYYGRTTNMDKWSSPWPLVVTINVPAAALLLWILVPRGPRAR